MFLVERRKSDKNEKKKAIQNTLFLDRVSAIFVLNISKIQNDSNSQQESFD